MAGFMPGEYEPYPVFKAPEPTPEAPRTKKDRIKDVLSGLAMAFDDSGSVAEMQRLRDAKRERAKQDERQKMEDARRAHQDQVNQWRWRQEMIERARKDREPIRLGAGMGLYDREKNEWLVQPQFAPRGSGTPRRVTDKELNDFDARFYSDIGTTQDEVKKMDKFYDIVPRALMAKLRQTYADQLQSTNNSEEAYQNALRSIGMEPGGGYKVDEGSSRTNLFGKVGWGEDRAPGIIGPGGGQFSLGSGTLQAIQDQSTAGTPPPPTAGGQPDVQMQPTGQSKQSKPSGKIDDVPVEYVERLIRLAKEGSLTPDDMAEFDDAFGKGMATSILRSKGVQQ